MINKGRWNPDVGYEYVCHYCNDSPIVASDGRIAECPYCYGGDWDKLVAQFATARGERYYALWKTMLRMRGKQWVDAFNAKRAGNASGKVSVADMLEAFVDTGIPQNRWKPYVEWLEERDCIRAGTYEDLKERGLKVGEAIEQVLAERRAS